MLYPGCLRLFQELDRSWTPETPSSNLVFLSARPHVYKDLSETKSYKAFKEFFEQGKMHVIPSLLPGSLKLGAVAMFKALCMKAQGWRQVGEKKARTFEQYKRLYQEYDFVFCGDNGQGDLLAGQRMLRRQATRPLEAQRQMSCCEDQDSDCSDENEACGETSSQSSSSSGTVSSEDCSKHHPKLLAVLIHEVIPNSRCLSLYDDDAFASDEDCGCEPWREALARERLFLHSSYVAAALALHRVSLLSMMQLRSVAVAAQEDFNTGRLMFPEWAECWGPMEEILRRDLQAVSESLVSAGEEPLPELRRSAEFVSENAPFNRRTLRRATRVYSDLGALFGDVGCEDTQPTATRRWTFYDIAQMVVGEEDD